MNWPHKVSFQGVRIIVDSSVQLRYIVLGQHSMMNPLDFDARSLGGTNRAKRIGLAELKDFMDTLAATSRPLKRDNTISENPSEVVAMLQREGKRFPPGLNLLLAGAGWPPAKCVSGWFLLMLRKVRVYANAAWC